MSRERRAIRRGRGSLGPLVAPATLGEPPTLQVLAFEAFRPRRMRQLLAANSVAIVVQALWIGALNRNRPIDVARSVARASTAIHVRAGWQARL
jgi:hypothetical protein